jgi:hypothetical protein
MLSRHGFHKWFLPDELEAGLRQGRAFSLLVDYA